MIQLDNKPYEYCHTYRLMLSNRNGVFWMNYPMHCDHPKPMHMRNIIELKKRLMWTYNNYRVRKINYIKPKRNGKKNKRL